MPSERQGSTGSAADWGATTAAESIDAAVPLLAQGRTSDQVGAALTPPVSGQAVRNWLSVYPPMREAVRELQRDMADAVARRAMAALLAAVDVTASIAGDTRIEPQHRLRAAKNLSDIAFKAKAHTEVEEFMAEVRARLDAEEAEE
jgi:hypothetical protein